MGLRLVFETLDIRKSQNRGSTFDEIKIDFSSNRKGALCHVTLVYHYTCMRLTTSNGQFETVIFPLYVCLFTCI